MDSSKLFIFSIDSGLLLKNLSDVLLLCSEKTCVLTITETTLTFSKVDKSFPENDCKLLIIIDALHLSGFNLKYPLTVTLPVKHFNKFCKTLKKRDKVSIWIDDSSMLHLEVKDEVTGITKVEEKAMAVTVTQGVEPNDAGTINDRFYSLAFTVTPSLIQGVKKSIGTKESPVEIKLQRDEYLEFNSTWAGTGPLRTIFGKQTTEFTNIIVSAGVITVLSKLSQLCNKLRFHQQKNMDDVNVLKISGKIDSPSYLGEVLVLIKAKGRH